MLPQTAQNKGQAVGLSVNLQAYMASTQDLQRILANGVNADGSLQPETIRAVLKFKGVDIRPLAELHGTSDQYFHQVINRQRRDVEVENIIAERLGFPADRVWGRNSDEPAA